MNILEKINFFANSKKDSIAIFNENCEDKELTYKELNDFSDKLAYYLELHFDSRTNLNTSKKISTNTAIDE